MLRFEIIDVAFLKSPLGLKGTAPSNKPKVTSDINQTQRISKSEQTLSRFKTNMQAFNRIISI